VTPAEEAFEVLFRAWILSRHDQEKTEQLLAPVFERAIREAQEAARGEEREAAWVIETGSGPFYWSAPGLFTANNLEAARFVRREDAERVMNRILPNDWRVTQHAWPDIRTPKPGAEVERLLSVLEMVRQYAMRAKHFGLAELVAEAIRARGESTPEPAQCVCSHEKRHHRDGRHCIVDDGHPEHGGPDPCGCTLYEDGEAATPERQEPERCTRPKRSGTSREGVVYPCPVFAPGDLGMELCNCGFTVDEHGECGNPLPCPDHPSSSTPSGTGGAE
jgi:hypothetical protein